MGVMSSMEPPFFHNLLHEGRTPQTGVGADDRAFERKRFQADERRRPFIAVRRGALRPDLSHGHPSQGRHPEGVGCVPRAPTAPCPITFQIAFRQQEGSQRSLQVSGRRRAHGEPERRQARNPAHGAHAEGRMGEQVVLTRTRPAPHPAYPPVPLGPPLARVGRVHSRAQHDGEEADARREAAAATARVGDRRERLDATHRHVPPYRCSEAALCYHRMKTLKSPIVE